MADFDIFDDPETPFSTFNFQYSNEAFTRLHDLMEFNTLNNLEVGPAPAASTAGLVSRKKTHRNRNRNTMTRSAARFSSFVEGLKSDSRPFTHAD